VSSRTRNALDDRRLIRTLAVIVASVAWLRCVPTIAENPPASPRQTTRPQAVHVLNRLAFGPTDGQVEQVVQTGWRDWVEAQFAAAEQPQPPPDLQHRLADYPSLQMSMAQAYRAYRPPSDLKPTDPRAQRRLELQKQRLRIALQEELRDAVLIRAVHSPNQLQEVIVNFWRNHFNVDHDKCPYWANHYAQQVLRAHAFGRFEDLLMASAQHPAMLVYLDNHVSRKDHLNENYARELMELHTLGVDNGYTQSDVEALARVLTGWTCFWRYDDGVEHWRFVFRPEHHDDQPARVMDLRLDGRGGVADGERVIRYLAHHEHTADFIADKLCRYLVADDPPAPLVRHVAAVFRATGGDLKQVYRAIIFSDEFMDERYFGGKYKTPFEFVVSALRAVDAQVGQCKRIHEALEAMAQPIYQCAEPTGYDDAAEAWSDPGAAVYRWDFALRLSGGRLIGTNMAPPRLHAWQSGDADAPQRMVRDLLPGGIGAVTAAAIAQTDDVRRRVGLILASPEFQQQ